MHIDNCPYCSRLINTPVLCPECGKPMRFTDYRQEGKKEASWLTAAWYECDGSPSSHRHKIIWYVCMPWCYWEHWKEDHEEQNNGDKGGRDV